MNIDQINSLPPKQKTLLFKEAIELSGRGHCLEFGVWQGGSLRYLAELAPDRAFHGFDSFKGLPEDWDKGNEVYQKGHFSVPFIPTVNNTVILHGGWFEETIPKWKEEYEGQVAFIHVDSDLYSSCKTILETLNDRIIPGTVILFDELCDFTNGNYPAWKDHEWKAALEWEEKYKRTLVPISRTAHFQVLTIVEV